MNYTPEQIEQLTADFHRAVHESEELSLKGIVEAQALKNERAKMYLQQGAGRRVHVLRNSILQIFHLFPMEQVAPLNNDDITQVQINLHAFVMNLSGIFDNWAWAFVYRHELLGAIGDRRHVGLFRTRTQRFFPEAFREYVNSEGLAPWHENYVKGLSGFRWTTGTRRPVNTLLASRGSSKGMAG